MRGGSKTRAPARRRGTVGAAWRSAREGASLERVRRLGAMAAGSISIYRTLDCRFCVGLEGRRAWHKPSIFLHLPSRSSDSRVRASHNWPLTSLATEDERRVRRRRSVCRLRKIQVSKALFTESETEMLLSESERILERTILNDIKTCSVYEVIAF